MPNAVSNSFAVMVTFLVRWGENWGKHIIAEYDSKETK